VHTTPYSWYWPTPENHCLDRYLVTIDEIERVPSEKIPVADYARQEKPINSWTIPLDCERNQE